MYENRNRILLAAILLLTISLVVVIFMTFSNAKANQLQAKIEIKNGLIYKIGTDVPYTGRILDTLQNKILEYDVLEGMKTGEFCLLSITGEFEVHGFLKQNKNVGPWRYFYKNGQLESQGNFREDQPHGEWIWYFENGKIKSIGYYINGNSEGTWRTFDESGRVTSVVTYKNGQVQSEVILERLSFS